MKWNNTSVVSVCLLNLIYHIGAGLAHKCFVCGPDSGKYEDDLELKRNFPDSKVPLCSTYGPKMRDAFIRDCPTNMKGCLTKIEAGGSIMRNCAKHGIDDCKEANGVTYCYCSSDKCNTPDRRLSDPSPSHPSPRPHDDFAPHAQSQMSPPDDEDNEEGSAGWASFYYDNYYDEHYDLGEYPRGFHGDTVEGDDPGDYADVTEPPPFIQNELERETHLINKEKNKKNNRDKFNNKDNNDIVFGEGDEDYRRRPGGGDSAAGRLVSLSAAATLMLSLLAAWL